MRFSARTQKASPRKRKDLFEGVNGMKNALFVLLLMASVLQADTVTLQDGTVYEGSITKVEPNQITLMTDSGIKKIPLEKLSRELQEKYSYSAERAAAYAAEQKSAADAAKADIQKTLEAQKNATNENSKATSPAEDKQIVNVEELRKELATELRTWAEGHKPKFGKSNSFWEWDRSSLTHILKLENPVEDTPWVRASDAGLFRARSLADSIKISLLRTSAPTAEPAK